MRSLSYGSEKGSIKQIIIAELTTTNDQNPSTLLQSPEVATNEQNTQTETIDCSSPSAYIPNSVSHHTAECNTCTINEPNASQSKTEFSARDPTFPSRQAQTFSEGVAPT